MNSIFDYIVIGSGFGGSVASLRLSEKGYSVLTIEKGKRYRTEDFPKTNWNLKKYLWMPKIGFRGFQRLDLFKHAFILSGVGVGGGSLVYANTLMQPPATFFKNNDWEKFNDWENVLKPHYETAHMMLGRTKLNKFYKEDEVLREVAKDMGKENSFDNVYVAVNYEGGEQQIDPYFGGEGPLRNACTECAGCMVGCRENAKNTLDKNYLYFAEKAGNQLVSETKVFKIEYLDSIYHIHTKSNGKKQVYKSKGIIFSGGVLGSLKLLLHQKHIYKTLPNISDRLGENLRTNSETLCTASGANVKLNNGVAISSIFKPEKDTYIEIVKYPDGSNVMKTLLTLATGSARLPILRPFKFLGNIILHPFTFFKMMINPKWAENTIIFLVMQTVDNAMRITLRKGLFRKNLTIKNDGKKKVPAFIPVGQEVMNRYAKKVNAIPQNSTAEILFNIPSTAHILGGCPMGNNMEEGVIDKNYNVFGYPNMYVIDGSTIQGNLGVNPSFTITATAEYAMSIIPDKTESVH
jgi:cholesterol oxidase